MNDVQGTRYVLCSISFPTQILASQRSNGSRSRTNVIVGSQMSQKWRAKVVCNSREIINLSCSRLIAVCFGPFPAGYSSYPPHNGTAVKSGCDQLIFTSSAKRSLQSDYIHS